MIQKSTSFFEVSRTQLQCYAQTLAQQARAGDVFALHGAVGAGKTTFAQAFIRALCGEATEVTSPTFTLVHQYVTPQGATLWHYDLYRIEHPHHVVELALEEALCDGITLIEWPEMIQSTLPTHTLHITFAFHEKSEYRTLRFDGEDIWIKVLQTQC